jgi:hypothetical protein
MIEAILKGSPKETMELCLATMGPGGITNSNMKSYAYYPGNKFLLCAHVDTRKYQYGTNKKLLRYHDTVTSPNSVLGADGRAGILALFSIFEEMKKHPPEMMPGFLFTDGWNVRGWGMRDFLRSEDRPELNDYNVAIGLDLDGAGSMAYYDGISIKLINYMESFGFIDTYGDKSDVAYLTGAFALPAFSLSIGFWNSGTEEEFWHVSETMITARRVVEMLLDPVEHKYPVSEPYCCNTLEGEYLKLNYPRDVKTKYVPRKVPLVVVEVGGEKGKGEDAPIDKVDLAKDGLCPDCGKEFDADGFCGVCGTSKYGEKFITS